MQATITKCQRLHWPAVVFFINPQDRDEHRALLTGNVTGLVPQELGTLRARVQ